MIIYIKHYEQLCNRIWAILPALSYALHNDKKLVIIWAFKPYMDLFPNLRKDKHIVSIFEKKEFQYRRLIHRIWKKYDKYLASKKKFCNISKKNIVVFSGAWECRLDESFILEEKEYICHLFSPTGDVKDIVKKNICKKKGFIYVGVHIRRGDYATFSHGRFFYDQSYYYKLMDCLYLKFRSNGQNVKFVICSNETFDVCSESLLRYVKFTSDDLVYIKDSTPVIDLYALAECDYIFGPPSTFSQWASFYGGGKLLFIKEKSLTDIVPEQFKSVKLLDRFYE